MIAATFLMRRLAAGVRNRVGAMCFFIGNGGETSAISTRRPVTGSSGDSVSSPRSWKGLVAHPVRPMIAYPEPVRCRTLGRYARKDGFWTFHLREDRPLEQWGMYP